MAISVESNISKTPKTSESITQLSQLDLEGSYTYAEYISWKFKERVELIKGKLFKMSPAPNSVHQQVLLHLSRTLDRYFETKKCQLYIAPFDVRFPSKTNAETNTVVQPDLCVVCNLDKLDKQGCNGAPDLVVEILSPGNTQKEMNDKFNLYESSGVIEYWLVQPEDKWLIIYHLDENNKYIGSKPFTTDDGIVNSTLFSELAIDLNEIFDLLEFDS